MLKIRPATPADSDHLWQIMEPIIRAGETYDFPRDTTRVLALAAWLAPDFQCFVAEDAQHQVLGTFLPKPHTYIDDQSVHEWRFCKHVLPANALNA